MKNGFRKISLLTLQVVFVLIVMTGCGTRYQTVKEKNMQIELPGDYIRRSNKNTTWYYNNENASAFGIRNSKDDIEKSGLEYNTMSQFASEYIKANKLPSKSEIHKTNKYIYFEYEAKNGKDKYSYVTFMYNNKDEIWIVNFACYASDYSKQRASFFKAADSVKFSK